MKVRKWNLLPAEKEGSYGEGEREGEKGTASQG